MAEFQRRTDGSRWSPWACSSVVEHCVDIAGVASSILATPTIESLGEQPFSEAFVYLVHGEWLVQLNNEGFSPSRDADCALCGGTVCGRAEGSAGGGCVGA